MLNRARQLIRKKKNVRFLFFIVVLFWCIGFASQSLFPGSGFAIVTYPVLKRFYGTVCHQVDVKTFSFMGHKLFVCARCTGIYMGALLTSFSALFFFPRLKLGIKLLYAAILPVIIDVVMSTLDIYRYSKYLAFFTGLFFGSVVFIYILDAIENHFNGNKIDNNE